jgi:hypothetical protein
MIKRYLAFKQKYPDRPAVHDWTYGIEPNRKTLDTFFRYSYEQGLSSRKLSIEELFHPAGLQLVESTG